MASEQPLIKPPHENFLALIQQLIKEECYDGIPILLHDNKNKTNLIELCPDIIQICLEHLTDENYEKNLSLYSSCEEILKSLAKTASEEEILFELLEIVETTKSDNVFVSTLKALQLCLLREQENRRPRTLEWGLNSVQSFIQELEIPEFLSKTYDEKQETLLEQDDKISRILTNYITIGLFYEPIYKQLVDQHHNGVFRDREIDRKNILICFLIQMLGKPLAFLDLLSADKEKYTAKTNTYSLQCAFTITSHISNLIVDPFYFLQLIEQRLRWKRYRPRNKNSYTMAPKNIFLNEEKCPTLSLAIYYYMLFVNECCPASLPKIYLPSFIFENSLYLIVDLLKTEQPPLQLKGIQLASKILMNLDNSTIPSNYLDLHIYSDFCLNLSSIVIYSEIEKIRKLGIKIYESYILKFDLEGRYIILKKLIELTNHSGLLSFFMEIYKKLIAEQLETYSENEIFPNFYSGIEFKNLLLNCICKLKNSAETDLMENSDQILKALNILRYFSIRDKENLTGFWDLTKEIENKFLEPLKMAIDLSRAHFKAEQHRVQNNIKEPNAEKINKIFEYSLLSGEKLPSDFTKQQKLNMLGSALITFDMMESLIARVNELILK